MWIVRFFLSFRSFFFTLFSFYLNQPCAALCTLLSVLFYLFFSCIERISTWVFFLFDLRSFGFIPFFALTCLQHFSYRVEIKPDNAFKYASDKMIMHRRPKQCSTEKMFVIFPAKLNRYSRIPFNLYRREATLCQCVVAFNSFGTISA